MPVKSGIELRDLGQVTAPLCPTSHGRKGTRKPFLLTAPPPSISEDQMGSSEKTPGKFLQGVPFDARNYNDHVTVRGAPGPCALQGGVRSVCDSGQSPGHLGRNVTVAAHLSLRPLVGPSAVCRQRRSER